MKPANQKDTLIHHTLDSSKPWEKVGCDLVEISGRQYLITVDYATNVIEEVEEDLNLPTADATDLTTNDRTLLEPNTVIQSSPDATSPAERSKRITKARILTNRLEQDLGQSWFQSEKVTSAQSEKVTSAQSEKVTSAQSEKVTSAQSEKVTSAQSEKVTSAQAEKVTSAQCRASHKDSTGQAERDSQWAQGYPGKPPRQT
ncbi:hypothetical protein EGW08_007148 [Elysia chlorotica]|uniref:Uncharacterized protein n=1 Tax=Elysia chlorotica TaxID=188477 RepID=A0A3S1A879_ELYCH|nr:hypothetical protein EGW08_007148 [Elysia chlorotica]